MNVKASITSGGRVKIRNLSGALSLAGLYVYETCGVIEKSLANIVKLEFKCFNIVVSVAIRTTG